MSRRMPRLNEQLKREITEIVRFEVNDPRVGFVTITGVEATPDLMEAKVHVSIMGEEEEEEESLEGLRAAAPFIRTALAQRLSIRRIPELVFQPDRSLAHAQRIERLLSEVSPPADGEGGEDAEASGPDEESRASDGE